MKYIKEINNWRSELSSHNHRVNNGVFSVNSKTKETFVALLETKPSNADAYYNRGELKAIGLNDIKGAIEDFLIVIKLNPNHSNALWRLSEAYSILFAFKTASKCSAKAIKLDNQNEIVVSGLALMQIYFKKYNHAERNLLLIENYRFYSNGFYNCWAYIYIEQGNYLEAVEMLTISIDHCSYGNKAVSYFNRGLLKVDHLNLLQEGIQDLHTAYELGELGAYIRLVGLRKSKYFLN